MMKNSLLIMVICTKCLPVATVTQSVQNAFENIIVYDHPSIMSQLMKSSFIKDLHVII